MSIRRRLYVLVGVALLPAVLIQAYDQVVLRREREAEIEDDAVHRAQSMAAQIGQVIEGGRQIVHAITQLREVRTRDAAACSQTLTALNDLYPGYSSLSVVGMDGRAICTSLGLEISKVMSVADRDYFQQALARGGLYVGGHINSRYQPKRVLPITAPFRDLTGATAGVVILAFRLDWLAEILDRPDWSLNQTLTVADANGVILVRFPDNSDFVGKPVPAAIWDPARGASAPGTVASGAYDGIVRVIGFVPPSVGPGGFYVATGRSREAAFTALNTGTFYGIMLICAGIGVALLLVHFTGETLIRQPVLQLISTARRWRAGHLSARSGLSGPNEFGRLGAAFDAMATDLERAFADKDLLLRELSHRVTNSLSSIAGLLRLQAARSEPMVRRQLDDAIGRIQALALTYRRLQMGRDGDRLDFGQYLRDLWEDLVEAVAPAGVQGGVQVEPLPMTPEQAAPLAIVAHELVTNALKYSQPATGPIELRLDRSGEDWCLTVTNPGALPLGFDPATSKGFGLTMASALARQAKGQLRAACQDGSVTFTVLFAPRERAAIPATPDGHVAERCRPEARADEGA
jgi:two-component sensor histidine kinase